MKKFTSNLIMFIAFIAYEALVIFLFIENKEDTAFYVGIPLAIIYTIICFFIKRVRSRMTVWWGILSLLTATTWIYLLLN